MATITVTTSAGLATYTVNTGTRGPTGSAGADGATGSDGAAGVAGATGPAGPAPSGTGFVKVTSGVLDTPSATIPHTSITGLGTAATANTSTSGGANKVPLTTSTGNLVLGTPTGNMNTGVYDGTSPLDSFFMQNMKQLGWFKADGTTRGAYFYYWQNHDVLGRGEFLINSEGTIAIIPSDPLQFGNNSAGRDHVFFRHVSGMADVTNPLLRSRASVFQTNGYDGSTHKKDVSIQAFPLDTANSAQELRFLSNATCDEEYISATRGDFSGTTLATMRAEGIYEPGKAPAFTTLPPGAAITQTCSIYRTIQNAKVTLGQNTTLIISGAVDGMKGVIYVKQPPSGGPWTLTPDGGSVLDTSTTANYLDRVAWEYDGATINFQTTKNISQALTGLDADASGFIARNGTTDLTEKSAINTLVSGLKSASLWTKLIAFYPFVGGTSTAHSKNLIADAYNITWTGTPTTSTLNGCKGDASTVHGSTGINLSSLGYVNAVTGYACTRGTALTDATYLFGATDGTGRFGLYRNGASMYLTGATSNSSGPFAATGHVDHYLFGRSSTTAAFSGKGSQYGTSTDNVTGAPNLPILIFARNNSGSVGGRTDAALSAAAFFNTSLNSTEWNTLRGLVNTFNTTIGRAP